MKIKAILDIDKEILFKIAGTDSFEDAFEQEIGWIAASGIALEDWEYENEEEK